jgi:hypothetical protein
MSKVKMSKKGLSDVVTTVLIILFAVIAVTVIGAIVLNQVKGAGGKIDTATVCQQVGIEPVRCTYTKIGADNAAGVLFRRSGAVPNVVLVNVSLLVEYSDGTLKNDGFGSGISPMESKLELVVLDPAKTATNFKVATTLKDANGQVFGCEPSQPVVCSNVSVRGSGGTATVTFDSVTGKATSATLSAANSNGYAKNSVLRLYVDNQEKATAYLFISGVNQTGGVKQIDVFSKGSTSDCSENSVTFNIAGTDYGLGCAT